MAAAAQAMATQPNMSNNALRSITAWFLKYTLEPFFKLVGGKANVSAQCSSVSLWLSTSPRMRICARCRVATAECVRVLQVWPPTRRSAPFLSGAWVFLMGMLVMHLRERRHRAIEEVSLTPPLLPQLTYM
eukprot:COSAG06_NODE_688_length_13072_cov_15.012719_7_plen_131_part_00